jgi:hypothetical protein
VPAPVAARDVQRWQSAPVVQAPASCADALGPSGQTDPGLAGDPAGPVGALETYFRDINGGNYAGAYAVLGPAEQAAESLEAFAAATSTSFDTDFQLGDVVAGPGGTVVSLTFTSLQAVAQGPSGDTCDIWTLDYTMAQDGTGAWGIVAAVGRNGSTHSRC